MDESALDAPPGEQTESTFWRYAGGFVLLAVVAAGVWYVQQHDLLVPLYEWFRTDFKGWLDRNPLLGPAVFILVYIVTVVALVPGSVLTLIAGAVFGPLWGLIIVSVAATLAAGAAFLVARYVAADWVQRKTSGRLAKLKKGIEEEGWRFVAFTRLVPIFPYNLLNYMFGLTRINFWVYFFVSWLCMLPGTFAYVYAGYAGRKVVFGEGGWGNYVFYVVSAVGVLLFASMLPKLVRRLWGQPVDEVIEEADGPESSA